MLPNTFNTPALGDFQEADLTFLSQDFSVAISAE